MAIVNIFKKKEKVVDHNQETKEVVGMSEEEARIAFYQAMATAQDEIAKKEAEKTAAKEAKKQAKKENNERILAEYRARKAEKQAAKAAKKADKEETTEDEDFTEVAVNEAPVEEAGAEKIIETEETINGNKVFIVDGERRYIPNFRKFHNNTESTEEDKNIGFSFGDTFMETETDNNGVVTEISELTSSREDASIASNPETKFTNLNDIKDYIVADATIRELVPGVNRNNIEFRNGLILLNIPRGDEVIETYRVDLDEDQVYIQAPMNGPLFDYKNNKMYAFVSVPTSTDMGREILTTPNYIADINKVDTMSGTTVLRTDEHDS